MADTFTPRELRILREIAGDYDYQASVSQGRGSTSNQHKFEDRAFVARKAARLLEPAPANVIEAVVGPLLGAVE